MKKVQLFSLFISLILLSCSNSNDEAENCLDYKHAFITAVDVEPMTVKINDDLPIELTYFIENSCGSFYTFEVNRNSKTYDIKVKAKYEGCQCNEMASNLQTTYHFRTLESGIYTLNFYTSSSEFVSKVIYVK